MNKKRIFLLFSIVIAFFIGTFFFRKNSDLSYEKWLMIQQKIIPIFFLHPKNRIDAYISNANSLFSCAQKATNQEKALNLAFRAEHSMTLLVGEVRRLHNTNIISYSSIFDAYKGHRNILENLQDNTDPLIQKNFQTITQFAIENEKTTKTIYYNAIHPGDIVPN